jgi:hypothetical protein
MNNPMIFFSNLNIVRNNNGHNIIDYLHEHNIIDYLNEHDIIPDDSDSGPPPLIDNDSDSDDGPPSLIDSNETLRTPRTPQRRNNSSHLDLFERIRNFNNSNASTSVNLNNSVSTRHRIAHDELLSLVVNLFESIDGTQKTKMTENEFSFLTTKLYSDLKTVDGLYHDNTCSMCLEVHKDETSVTALGCGHYFCTECIKEWVTKHSLTCPSCRHINETVSSTPNQNEDQ